MSIKLLFGGGRREQLSKVIRNAIRSLCQRSFICFNIAFILFIYSLNDDYYGKSMVIHCIIFKLFYILLQALTLGNLQCYLEK